MPKGLLMVMTCRLLLAILLTVLATDAFGQALDQKELERRASLGEGSAIHALCYSELYGDGLPKNLREAFRWCKEGAELGLSSSQTLLAEMYRFGYYVSKDDTLARHWYEAAAKQGHVHAQFMLGRLILQYAKTNEDTHEACKWFLSASDAGYQKATDQLKELDRSWADYHKGAPPREHFCQRETVHSDVPTSAAETKHK